MRLIQDKRDSMMFKLFVGTLYDGAQKWFNNLAPYTITSFSQFSKLFIINNANNKPMRKESYHLFSIIQGNWAPIDEYMMNKIGNTDLANALVLYL